MDDRRVYVFQHVACEDLGSFAEALARRDFEPIYIRLFAGDAVPDDCHSAAALLVLGGPMSVNDEASLPYLRLEKEVLRQALAVNQPVLGVCLGAQLLASAAGSRVFPGARPEIGWSPISFTVEGQQDAVVRELGSLASVFHWHGETFDLPPGAIRLAFSGLTMNQAFRIGRTAYGLQFHVEVDAPMIQSWVREYARDLGGNGRDAMNQIAADTAQYVSGLRDSAKALMQRFLDIVERAPRP